MVHGLSIAAKMCDLEWPLREIQDHWYTKMAIILIATGWPIDMVFGSRVGFSGTPDLTVKVSVFKNRRWRMKFTAASRGFPARARLSCLYLQYENSKWKSWLLFNTNFAAGNLQFPALPQVFLTHDAVAYCRHWTWSSNQVSRSKKPKFSSLQMYSHQNQIICIQQLPWQTFLYSSLITTSITVANMQILTILFTLGPT